jgi:transcriptional regulator with XRE-family HTH domain
MQSDATRQARIGRPKSLDIRGDRVLDLRNELRLNQEAMAKAVYADQGRDRHVTEEALRQAAYRWEAGKVASKDLEPLARVLKTTVVFLLGGAPAPEPDRLKEIEQQLARQLDAGNPATRAVVERHRNSDPEEDFPSALRSVAEWVTASLEAAQLTRRQTPLNGLKQCWRRRRFEPLSTAPPTCA